MEEKNIWAGMLHAIKLIESIKAELEAAYDARDREMANLYKNGVAIAEIARRAQLSQPTIHKILKQQGAKS